MSAILRCEAMARHGVTSKKIGPAEMVKAARKRPLRSCFNRHYQ